MTIQLHVCQSLIMFLRCVEGSTDPDGILSMEMIHVLARVECVQKYVRQTDYAFYTGLLDVLLPDVLRPIPSKYAAVGDGAVVISLSK